MKKTITFEHYIITRFNLPIFQAKVNGEKSNSCDKDYLDYRFELFERYCFPSFVNQSCQDFKWLVLFDSDTPHEYKERTMQLHKEYNNFVPCFLNLSQYSKIPQEYVDLSNDYDEVVSNHFPDRKLDLDVERERNLRFVTPLFIMDNIRKCSSSTPDYYITTRIDNDDAFHKDMVKTIHERFMNNPQHVVYDFVYSYKYILKEGVTYRYPLQNGHFITLVEPSIKLFQSVLYWNHLYIDKFVKVEHIYQKPLQTELIHGNNVVNDFTEISVYGILYALLHFKLKDFGYRNTYRSYWRTIYILASIIKNVIIKRY